MGLISRVSSRTYRNLLLFSPELRLKSNFNFSVKKKSIMSSEQACTYAALILQDEGMEISADNLQKLIKAAGVSVEPFWPGLFASALEGCNVADLITNIGSGVGSGAPAAGGAAAAAGAAEEAPKQEAKKEESESESDDDMGFGLFD